jgi:hypothetical protein
MFLRKTGPRKDMDDDDSDDPLLLPSTSSSDISDGSRSTAAASRMERGSLRKGEQLERPVTTKRPVVQRRAEPQLAKVAKRNSTEKGAANPPNQQLKAALNAASEHVLRYDQLRDVTNGFAANKVLGQGAFATVYLGQLGKRKVAVKKEKPVVVEEEALEKTLQLLEQQFSSEIQTLYRYHHPNICALLGHAIDGPSRCLVYEYCANGALYGKINPLTWPQRLRISHWG